MSAAHRRVRALSKRRQRKPRLKTILAKARKAGAASVTIDGVTYTLGQAPPEPRNTNAWDEVFDDDPHTKRTA
jgi:hypothetical protein